MENKWNYLNPGKRYFSRFTAILAISLNVCNGILYFGAQNANGNELWKSDGTTAGTVMVANINTTSTKSSDPRDLASFKNAAGVTELFFHADNGADYPNSREPGKAMVPHHHIKRNCWWHKTC